MGNTDVLPDAGETDLKQISAAYLTTHRAKLIQAIENGQRGIDVASRYAAMFDGLLRILFETSARRLALHGPGTPRVAAIAVGAYGRGFVAPHSDIDLLFLCENATDPRVLRLAEAVLYPLWDCGVDVGHAVRSIQESLDLSLADIRTATTLLDMRHVAGDHALTAELVQRGNVQVIDGERESFISALVADTKHRHERYGDTLYLREPEIKSGRGGLRDLDVILWVGRARWAVEDMEGLVAAGGMTENEWLDLRAAREHLWSVRNQLHHLAGRRQDRLTFEDQEVIAGRMGYRDMAVALGVEQLMQVHYRHARVIAHLVDGIAERSQRVHHPPGHVRTLSRGIMVHDGRIELDEAGLQDDPSMALRLYRAVQRERLPPAPTARDAIASIVHDRDWCQRLRRAPASGINFLEMISEGEHSPVRHGSVLSEMHDLGVLLAMIPEFEPVMCRAPHDAYFAYTVDAQSVMAANYLQKLVRGEHAAEYRDVSRAAAEMPRPVPLYLALLLHAIGANHPDDPAGYSAAVAGHVARRMGLDVGAVRHVQWLIGMQRAFYNWATRRDINDPETITEVASEIQTTYRLRDLYLFTFANVATANPTAMNAWNARMLRDLWRAARNYLEGREDDVVQRLSAELFEGVEAPEDRATLRAFVAEMPVRYLLSNTAEGIRFHCRVGDRPDGRPVVAATPSGIGDDAIELVVVIDDRRGVLADLTAALIGFGFEIDSAQLYTRNRADGRREAFDLFHLHGCRAQNADQIEKDLEALRERIEELQAGKITADEFVSHRKPRPSWVRSGPRIKTDIHIDNEASSSYTVIDVFTRARDALLHTIARELNRSGLSIALAKVNTEGDRVADVFYVVTESGGKLNDGEQVDQLCARLRRAINAIDRGK